MRAPQRGNARASARKCARRAAPHRSGRFRGRVEGAPLASSLRRYELLEGRFMPSRRHCLRPRAPAIDTPHPSASKHPAHAPRCASARAHGAAAGGARSAPAPATRTAGRAPRRTDQAAAAEAPPRRARDHTPHPSPHPSLPSLATRGRPGRWEGAPARVLLPLCCRRLRPLPLASSRPSAAVLG